MHNTKRRPIHFRQTHFASRAAVWLAKRGWRPNQISLLSLVFSVCAALSLIANPYCTGFYRSLLFLFAALFILLRLLCNLFDGMIAIEGKQASRLGEIYNDLPDRPSDLLILVAVGYAIIETHQGVILGWVAAIFALMTAYVRLLGCVAGTKAYFIGPMAKQQRMVVMMAACILSALESGYSHVILSFSLWVIIVGSAITIVRRLQCIVRDLKE